MCIFCLYFHPVLSFQVSTGEFIYLVFERSSFFGFSSSSNQYLSYESRSSWLLWLLSSVLSPTLSSSLSISLASSPPLSLVLFVFFLSIPVSFFPPLYSRSVFFLPLSSSPSWKITLPIWTEPWTAVTLLVALWNWLKIDQSTESELVKTFLLLRPLLVSPPHTLNSIG